jgi:hypothetical protein
MPLEVYRQILITHIRAYNLIHRFGAEQGWLEPMVTLNNYCATLLVGQDCSTSSRCGNAASGWRIRDYIFDKIHQFERGVCGG